MALLILLLIVLSGGPSGKSELIPWLPLYIVATCLVTAAIYELPFRITRNHNPPVAQVYADTDSAPPSPTSRGYRASSDFSEPRAPSQTYCYDARNFQHMGPSSSRSVQTGSDATELSLGNVAGAKRDPRAAIIYGNANSDHDPLQAINSRFMAKPGADPYDAAVYMELADVRPSQDSVQGSRAPLLESYD